MPRDWNWIWSIPLKILYQLYTCTHIKRNKYSHCSQYVIDFNIKRIHFPCFYFYSMKLGIFPLIHFDLKSELTSLWCKIKKFMDIFTLGLTQRNANQTQLSQERKLVVLFLKEVTITRTSFGRKWFPLRMNRSKLIFKVQMKFSFDEHST